LAGAGPEKKSSWKGRGERSVLGLIDIIESVPAQAEAVVALDIKARIAI
jgi:hypothetical protein